MPGMEPGLNPSAEMAKDPIDVSDLFAAAVSGGGDALIQFDDELRKFRREPQLKIAIDWNVLPADENMRRGIMRKMKAMREYKPSGQAREMIIRGSHADRAEAARIEANVLASGVRWEFTDEAVTE